MKRNTAVLIKASALLVALWGAFYVSASVQTISYDYSALYEELNPSIVKIFADCFTGSGFLIAGDGLIATNHHVISNARYIAVQFADGRKVRAAIVTMDPRRDVVILKVNSAVVQGIRPLALLTAEKEDSIKAGMPVVAFGSPLSQTFLMTQGIVSKVEENALLGDFLIDHGNSGGPLVNLAGEVIGINTFGVGQKFSGAVRVNALRRLQKEVAEQGTTIPEPPAALLSTINRTYPPDILKTKLLNEKLEEDAYILDAGKFTITAITPVSDAKADVQADLMQAVNRYNRRGKKITGVNALPADLHFYEWYRNSEFYLDWAVTFQVKPDFGETKGSFWKGVLYAVSIGIAAGFGNSAPVQDIPADFEFKAEFSDLRIYKDGKLIEPVVPGRAITERSFANPRFTFVDEAYSGMYIYSPEDFRTGDKFVIEVYEAREPNVPQKTIELDSDSKFIRQIRSDFPEIRISGSELTEAVKAGQPAKTNRLIELIAQGVPVDARDEEGDTALMIAAEMGDMPILELLLSKKAAVDLQDRDGKTALIRAAAAGQAAAVQFLILKGANTKIKTIKGKTALDVAKAEGHAEIVQILKDASDKR